MPTTIASVSAASEDSNMKKRSVSVVSRLFSVTHLWNVCHSDTHPHRDIEPSNLSWRLPFYRQAQYGWSGGVRATW